MCAHNTTWRRRRRRLSEVVYIRLLRMRSGPHSDPRPDSSYLRGSSARERDAHAHLVRLVSIYTGLPTRLPVHSLSRAHDAAPAPRTVRSYVPSVTVSASTNGSAAAERQQQLREPAEQSETGVETVPGQQRQLPAGHHPVGQGEPEQALEEPGEPVHGQPRSQAGAGAERGQREAGEPGERETGPGEYRGLGRGRENASSPCRPLGRVRRAGAASPVKGRGEGRFFSLKL